MKYAITTLILFTFILCNAQTMRVTYTEKTDLTEKLESIDNPMIKQKIIEKAGKPKYYELISNNGNSIYHKQIVEEEDIDNGVTMIGIEGEDIIYKNHSQNLYVRQTDFMSRTFLIEDTLQQSNWEIFDGVLKIGDYQCKKATSKKGDNDIIAWFTNEVPSNEGPRNFYGLPGLILKVETGTLIIEATNISISKDKATIQKPTKGKKVTQEEFDKIRKEKINGLTGDKQKGNGVQVIKM
ncbi:MAG: GLPGLI family protein [Tenacibaculum sp.]